MNKTKLIFGIIPLIILTFSIFSVDAFADPKDADKKASKGIYYLVTKDSDWDPQPRSDNPFGMGKFSTKDDQMHLVAHKLQPNTWYFIELTEKTNSCEWVGQTNSGDDVQFYGVTNSEGTLDMTFTLDLSEYTEINVKNTDWAFTPDGWLYTGNGWGYVLYGATTIPNACG